jgi:transcription elongation factor GreA
MFDELTRVDIEKIEEEIKYRENVLAPELRAEIKRTREFGDLSENAEYKEAKREKRKNEGRIRYLNNLLRTAKVIDVNKNDGVVNLFDKVTIYNEKAKSEKTVQIVTTLRQNALLGYVSKESPLGMALLGAALGERRLVKVNDTISYYVEIRAIEQCEDNRELPIAGY